MVLLISEDLNGLRGSEEDVSNNAESIADSSDSGPLTMTENTSDTGDASRVPQTRQPGRIPCHGFTGYSADAGTTSRGVFGLCHDKRTAARLNCSKYSKRMGTRRRSSLNVNTP